MDKIDEEKKLWVCTNIFFKLDHIHSRHISLLKPKIVGMLFEAFDSDRLIRILQNNILLIELVVEALHVLANVDLYSQNLGRDALVDEESQKYFTTARAFFLNRQIKANGRTELRKIKKMI